MSDQGHLLAAYVAPVASYDAQIEQLQQQTWNMEQAAMTTENLRNTMATVDAMKVANKELKKQYGKIDVDKIESIHYDMEDLIESANEIQESMSRTYGVPEDLDEADLQAGVLRGLCLVQAGRHEKYRVPPRTWHSFPFPDLHHSCIVQPQCRAGQPT